MYLQTSVETRWWQHRSAHLGEGQLLELTTALDSINDLQLKLHPSRPPSVYKSCVGIITACHPLFHTHSPLGQPRHTSDSWLDAKLTLILSLCVWASVRLCVCVIDTHTAHLCTHAFSAQVISTGKTLIGESQTALLSFLNPVRCKSSTADEVSSLLQSLSSRAGCFYRLYHAPQLYSLPDCGSQEQRVTS